MEKTENGDRWIPHDGVANPSETEPVVTGTRLLLGMASLGWEAVGSRLRAQADDAPAPASRVERPSAADTLVGIAGWGARTTSSMLTKGAELAAAGARSAKGATQLAGKLVPDFLNEPIDQARERLRLRLRRLGGVGREEIERSREVARDALDEGLDTIIGRLADSRELQLVIRTQSVTAGEEAVDNIRDQTARIDDRLEGRARRLLRKRPRPETTAPR